MNENLHKRNVICEWFLECVQSSNKLGSRTAGVLNLWTLHGKDLANMLLFASKDPGHNRENRNSGTFGRLKGENIIYVLGEENSDWKNAFCDEGNK